MKHINRISDQHNQYICNNCISEKSLKGLFHNSKSAKLCIGCNVRKHEIADIKTISEKIKVSIERDYEFIAVENLKRHSEVYEDELSTLTDEEYTVIDVIRYVAKVKNNVVDIIQENLYMLSDKGDYENPFHYNAYYTKRKDKEQKLISWKYLKTSIAKDSRFFNRYAVMALEDIFRYIKNYQTFDGEYMISHIEPYDPFFNLFRARYFDSSGDLEKALISPEKELGPPPPEVAKAGRMNAEGIPVFYGSTKPKVCLAEVRPPVGSIVIIARFEVTKHLMLLDIEHLKSAYIDQNDFSISRFRRPDWLNFIKNLNNQVIRPVIPEDESSEYLMTQVISEYLSGLKDLGIDGLIYKSSQSNDNSAKNIVLFRKSSIVESLSHSDRKSLFLNFQNSSDAIFDRSRLMRLQKEYNFKNIGRLSNKESTLKIDLDSISIYEIISAEFDTMPKIDARNQ